MKNKKRIGFCSIVVMSALLALPVYAGQWQKGSGKNSAKWWYNHLDGTYPKSSWAWIDGNGDGLAECYYFDQQGWLVVNKTVEGYKVDSTGAWLENGAVQVKSVSESGVFTNGKNEVSNGTIDMESDLELGTADKAAVSAEDKASIAVQDKTGSVLEVSGRFGGPGEGTSDFSSNLAVVAANGDMSDLIGYARSFIAVLPYKTAGSSLSTGADCSGFTQEIYKKFGISIPRDSRSQYAASQKISEEELQAGDLVFYGSSPSTIYHVGIYSGNGTIIHATKSGDYVREHDYHYAKPFGFGRYKR